MLFLIALVAFLYASVGHAGASGYIAVLTLFHVPPSEIKPTALVLNILVASIASFKFYRAGYFSWKLFWPFALASVPLAFLGGFMVIPGSLYKKIVGVILIYVVVRLSMEKGNDKNSPLFVDPPAVFVSLAWGAGIGFLSGLIGVGGGIFLTPLLVLQRWSCVKTAAGISAVFILLNSISGLTGFLQHGTIPSSVFTLLPVTVMGGYIGAELGSKFFPGRILRILLAGVLAIASVKLFLQV